VYTGAETTEDEHGNPVGSGSSTRRSPT
jgi:hypothetical protein